MKTGGISCKGPVFALCLMLVAPPLSGAVATAAAESLSVCRADATAGDRDSPSEDGTEAPEAVPRGNRGEDGASEGETPEAREPEGPGGCMFDRKRPLQLMV